jgi:hypothetical protein
MNEPAPLALRCLAGRPCPGDVVVDARSATKLSQAAVEQLPAVLVPCVTEAMTPTLASTLSQFSLRHEVAEADLGRTIRACRFVVREASAVDLPVEALAEDLAILFPEAKELRALLVERYDALKKALRAQLFAAALAEHGTVLDGVAYRVDLVAATDGAARLMMPVAMLTLTYREHGTNKKLTLQVPREVLAKLHEVTGALAR